MNRYYYYHVIYVGMINIMVLVPYLLISKRFNGAVSALPLAIVIGTLFAYITTYAFQRFQGLGLPEIYNRFLPRWLATSLNIVGSILWASGGLIVLYSYSNTIGLFFDPETNQFINLSIMALASVWAASRCSRSVQFTHEVLLLASSPLILWILLKAIFSPWLDWDAITVIAGNITKPPSAVAFFAATFVFSGHMNAALFNRLTKPGFKYRHRWIIPIMCSFFLLISFFVPIGFHGTQAVESYLYVWSVTTDCLMMKYGFIQRVLYLFLLLYTFLSLLFVMNTWHTAMEFIKACTRRYPPNPEQTDVPAINWLICGAFGVCTMIYAYFVNDQGNQIASLSWLITRFVIESILVILLLVFVYMDKKGFVRKGNAPRTATLAHKKTDDTRQEASGL